MPSRLQVMLIAADVAAIIVVVVMTVIVVVAVLGLFVWGAIQDVAGREGSENSAAAAEVEPRTLVGCFDWNANILHNPNEPSPG